MLGKILLTAVNAVLPIVLLILFGYWLRRKNFVTDDFLRVGNKFVFRICLLALLFINVYSIDGFDAISWDIVIFTSAVLCVLFLLGLITAVVTTPVPERRGVIAQCVFRSNFAIIGLPLAGALGGDAAISVAAVVSAFSIPLFNIFAVIVLSIFLDVPGQKKRSVGSVILGILKNPLIIGAVLGMVCLGLRELQRAVLGNVVFSLSRDLKFVYKCLENLKVMSTPLGLIVLGGEFKFSAVKGLFKEIAVSSVWRLILAPAIGLGSAVILSSMGLLKAATNEYVAMIALFGTPVAVSSAVMAEQMGNDEQLATQLVMWTSIGSVVTIFLQACILMAFGLIKV